MKYHKQTVLNEDYGGGKGSCYPTAIACLLDLELEQVPYFNLFYWSEEESAKFTKILREDYPDEDQYNKFFWFYRDLWDHAMKAFLYSRGIVPKHIEEDKKIKKWIKANPHTEYMAIGDSPRGVRHVCIYKNSKMIHDPHPSNSGILKIDYIEFLDPA